MRGLVVNIGDVLFDTGKYTLRPPAREALAKLSGIVLAYPGLKLQVEGHTDSTGTAAFNQKLSEQRAMTVRDYLVQQGVDMNSVTAAGLGQDMPIADNSTAAGRQKNRRVEIIVSGEVIGTRIGGQSGRSTTAVANNSIQAQETSRKSSARFSFLLALLRINLEVHNNFFATFKTRNRARGRLGAILFGVQFIVGIGIEAAEPVISSIVRDVTAHRIGPRILQEHHCRQVSAFPLYR